MNTLATPPTMMSAAAPAAYTQDRRVRTGAIALSLLTGTSVAVPVAVATSFLPNGLYL